MRLAFSLVLLCLALAGCTTGFQDRIDPRIVETMRLERINVSLAPDATFWWGDGERAYARSVGQSELQSETLGKTPEGQAFMRALAAQRIQAAFDRTFKGRLQNGTRPVRIEVVMQDIHVASAIQRIIIGGNHLMTATVNVVDAKSGEVIASNPKLTTAVQGGQGVLGVIVDAAINEPVDQVATALAMATRGWLINGIPIGLGS